MVDPIHELARLAYSFKKGSDYVKEKSAEWGHSISTKLNIKKNEVATKVNDTSAATLQQPEKKVKNSIHTASKDPAIGNSKIKQMSQKTSQYLQKLKTKFKDSYKEVKDKNQVFSEAKTIIQKNTKFEELSPKEQGLVKFYFAEASSKELSKTIKSMVQSNNPMTLPVFTSIIHNRREKVLSRVLKDTPLTKTFVKNIRAEFAQNPGAVWPFLNSTQSDFMKLFANALLTSEHPMENPDTGETVLTKDYFSRKLVDLYSQGPETIEQNKVLLSNLPSISNILSEVWNRDPNSAIKMVATLALSEQVGDKTGVGSETKAFVADLLKNQESISSFIEALAKFQPDDSQGMVEVLRKVPTSADNLIAGIVKNPAFEPSFLVKVSQHLIDAEVERVNSPGSIFRANDIGGKFIKAYLNELTFSKDPEDLSANLWPVISHDKLKLETEDKLGVFISQAGQKNYQQSMDAILEQVVRVSELASKSPMAAIYNHLYQKTEERFPSKEQENGKNAVIGTFVLRIFNPVLVNPDYDLHGEQTKNSVELAKILQTFASHQRFDKDDSYLRFMNTYLDNHENIRESVFKHLTNV